MDNLYMLILLEVIKFLLSMFQLYLHGSTSTETTQVWQGLQISGRSTISWFQR
jgi:hypothetical protein